LDTQNILGKGGFATVYKGLNAKDGNFVAVKAIDIKECSAGALKNIMV
jgi:serine/threonine protein kinase